MPGASHGSGAPLASRCAPRTEAAPQHGRHRVDHGCQAEDSQQEFNNRFPRRHRIPPSRADYRPNTLCHQDGCSWSGRPPLPLAEAPETVSGDSEASEGASNCGTFWTSPATIRLSSALATDISPVWCGLSFDVSAVCHTLSASSSTYTVPSSLVLSSVPRDNRLRTDSGLMPKALAASGTVNRNISADMSSACCAISTA